MLEISSFIPSPYIPVCHFAPPERFELPTNRVETDRSSTELRRYGERTFTCWSPEPAWSTAKALLPDQCRFVAPQDFHLCVVTCSLVPTIGLEPMTCCFGDSCSSAELRGCADDVSPRGPAEPTLSLCATYDVRSPSSPCVDRHVTSSPYPRSDLN